MVPQLTLSLLVCLLQAAGGVSQAAPVYSGIDNQIHVAIPRRDAQVTIDGVLDEPEWQQAAVLTGFSEYAPLDGPRAEQATEVLAWYSPSAIYFGIRAHAAPGTVHATLANRDSIEADDYVQIFLSTFNDGRRALIFAVNPLGIQEDGVLVEGITQPPGATEGLSSSRQPPDLSPDYVYESKGRLTDYGYEVEIRIPFKSLQYQSGPRHSWGLHIIRRVQSTGHEDSWAPAARAGVSFLRQAGTLEGMTDLQPGVLLDLNPFLTDRVDGAPRSPGGWGYDGGSPRFGGNLRWGITPNLTLNGTIKPDFSQVEADQAQFQSDPRLALYFPEKRPFFLDGIEQFATENQLIYTRRIVAPSVAAKLTGRISGTNVAILSAIDDQSTSSSGHDSPIVDLMRIQHDLPGVSNVALVYTDRIAGDYSNHVVAADAHLNFGPLYTLLVQAGGSTTRENRTTKSAPIWEGIFSRNGHRFNLKYTFTGIHEDFVAADGFIPRVGIVHGALDHQVTFYGRPEAFLQNFSIDVLGDWTWRYQQFVTGRGAEDTLLHFNNNFALRGGWQAGGSFIVESFGFDPQLYANYRLARIGANGLEVLPFLGVPHIPNLNWAVNLTTPQFARFSATLSGWGGHDENFYEWSPATVVILNMTGDWRPTDQIRVNGTYALQQYTRRSDGTRVGRRQVPRVRLEYQLSRHVLVRMVGQYTSDWHDNLRDDSRTNLPIYMFNPDTGLYSPALGARVETVQLNWLFAYQPTPGTVFFAGYNNAMATPDGARFAPIQRANDGFFMKLSYLFRLK